jgi:hypothetical protein
VRGRRTHTITTDFIPQATGTIAMSATSGTVALDHIS